MTVRRKYIRAIAEQLLEEHNMRTAPVDVEKIALSLGIEVQYKPTEDNVSGFLLRELSHHKALIGVNDSHALTRKRFTIAHELGHFLLHEEEKAHIDQKFKINRRDENSSKGISREEKEANLFAAELLMPASFIEQDFFKFDVLDFFDEKQLKDLADKYQVSTLALSFRLSYLGYVQS
jgi:Zn-dependent peptidase ImmA (M78 family)